VNGDVWAAGTNATPIRRYQPRSGPLAPTPRSPSSVLLSMSEPLCGMDEPVSKIVQCGEPQYRTSHEIYSWNLFAGVDWRF
jgi:hypothetical protein